YPTCKQWWSDPQYGLEQAIVKEVNSTVPKNPHLSELPLTDRILSWLHEIHAPFTTSDTADDIVARGALYDSNSMQDAHINTGGGILTHIANIGVTIGQLKNNLLTEPMDQAKAQDILPIVQAVLIFLILMFYPFVMIAGNYNLKVLSGVIFLLFSLIFTTAIWHALATLQDMINNSMSYVNFQNPEEKPIFNNFFTILYYLVPLFFNSLIAGAGVMLGDKLDSIANKSTRNFSPTVSSGGGGGKPGGGSGGGGSSSGEAAEAGEGVAEAAEVGAALL
ncbi:MAG: conjugal transfer protein TraG N-terminal domain-containing protein, partial [Coxiellaceae bacterium]|nr:conjugal transfer protein TraG N-terminal domain-containing protein [Coxiellaceae bacterium]